MAKKGISRRSTLIGVVLAAVLVGSFGVTAARLTTHGSTRSSAAQRSSTARVRPAQNPKYDPARFTARVSNPWFPLRPGVTFIYRGRKDGKPARDVYHVTHKIITIEGVPCRVVKDKLFLKGRLEEETSDYYTQDEEGNVWYFGEDTKELDRHGKVTSREGTWRTGRKGADAGIFMEANPQVGNQFQQEFFKGHAEDHYMVLSLTAEVSVPFGHFGANALNRRVQLTKEWTPLEPNVRDHKYYVRGIGEVSERTVKGPPESNELVKIVRRR
jgi:hypothetical protein